MMRVTLDREQKEGVAEVLCDMLLNLIRDFKDYSNVGENTKHEQNKGRPFKTKGIHICTSVFFSSGAASSGEYKEAV